MIRQLLGRGCRCLVLDMAATWPVHRSCKSQRTLPKCKCLITKQLTFIAVRGDLQEGYFALLDANFLSSWCQFPFSRAQNRGFCAFLPFETLIFGLFEHKIDIFVRFYPLNLPFSGISSTKSTFLCSGRRGNCGGALPSGDAAKSCLPCWMRVQLTR